jgi:TolB-like protein/Tfp pilus assembly protein PilF
VSTDPEQEYFCEGMAEELVNALAEVDGLRVAARTSSFALKGQNVNLRDIGRRLNVGAVLEGSVRRAGGRLRITAQLVDVSTGYQLWSERFDRELRDVFAVQDEISQAIVATLRVKLVDEREARLVRRPTADLEAYSLYLKGRFHWNKRTQASVQLGLELFEEAIAKDPDYALPYAGLADCYIILGYYGTLSPQRSFPLAKSAAQRALSLDATLAEAHTSLAFATMLYDRDWDTAEGEFQRALSLKPDYATAHHWYAEYLAFAGRVDEALEESRKALAYDPLSPIIIVLRGWTQYYARQYADAIDSLRRALELDPEMIPAHFWLGLSYSRRSMHREAVRTLERAAELSERSPLTLSLLAQVRAAGGEVAEARMLLSELIRRAQTLYVAPYHLAASHATLGEREEAYDWLERALEHRDIWCLYLEIDPVWDELRSEDRFAEVLRRVGLPE